MRQRVGFARALVVHPNILLMDEPFSALDVLTAETLRTDFLDLWGEGRLPIKGVILVTHNIEEAVLMCDRILLFSSNPGRIIREIAVDLKQPRNRLDPAFRELVEKIYVAMTRARPTAPRIGAAAGTVARPTIDTILPRVSANLLSGFVETLAGEPYKGNADLPVIADELHLEATSCSRSPTRCRCCASPRSKAATSSSPTPAGNSSTPDTDDRKKLFQRQLLAYVPLAAHIRRVLQERANHVAPKSRFFDELEDHMSTEAAEETLRSVTAWGRFGEGFAYDDENAISAWRIRRKMRQP